MFIGIDNASLHIYHHPIVVSDLSVAGAGRWGGAVRTFLLAEALQKLEHEVEIVGFLFGEASRNMAAAKIPIITVTGKNYLCSQTETDHLGNSSVKKTTDSQVRDKQLSNVKFLGYIQPQNVQRPLFYPISDRAAWRQPYHFPDFPPPVSLTGAHANRVFDAVGNCVSVQSLQSGALFAEIHPIPKPGSIARSAWTAGCSSNRKAADLLLMLPRSSGASHFRKGCCLSAAVNS